MRLAFCNAKVGVNVDNITMINFTEWIEFYTCIKVRYKLPDISNYRQKKANALAYLESQLCGISPDFIMDKNLETRSSKLRRQEELMGQPEGRSERLREMTR